MRRVLILSVGILLCGGVAFGQAGAIALFSDPFFSDCVLNDDLVGLAEIHIVHRATTGAIGVQFKVDINPDFTCMYLQSTYPFPIVVGDPLTGIAISYGTCLTGEILLASMYWFCQGTSAACSWLKVVPDPASVTGTIEVIDCSTPPKRLVGDGAEMFVNVDVSGSHCWPWCWGAVEDTNWGKVKALY